MRSTALLCVLVLCLLTLVSARQNIRRSSFPASAPLIVPFSSFPPEQQRIRTEYLTSSFLSVPHLPSYSSSSSSALPQPPPVCPCSNSSLCLPLTVGARPEVFVFQVRTDDWQWYDWSALTTVVVTTSVDPALLCYAHARQTRISLIANIPPRQLPNSSYVAQWVDRQVKEVTSTFTDGVNVDFESPLSSADAHQYTDALTLLQGRLHGAVKGSQLTVDVAWSPSCIDNRCYDVVGIAAVVDFMLVMSYDLRSQIYDLSDCQASANSPLRLVEAGLRNYTRLGIEPSQLVLGVPWYAYVYTCDEGTDPKAERCPIAHVPFQGAPCSDAAGNQVDFVSALALLRESTTGRRWNATLASPWFNVVQRNRTQQVWMDDVESLTLKYEMAKRMGLRGVGMWTADFLNYSQPIGNVTRAMWQALKIVVSKEEVGTQPTRVQPAVDAA